MHAHRLKSGNSLKLHATEALVAAENRIAIVLACIAAFERGPERLQTAVENACSPQKKSQKTVKQQRTLLKCRTEVGHDWRQQYKRDDHCKEEQSTSSTTNRCTIFRRDHFRHFPC